MTIGATLDSQRARDVVRAFDGARVLVIGDVMLDQFVIGRVNRISPEAPVPVVEHDHDEFRIGGAGNVAANVRTLGARVELVGLVGDDPARDRLRIELTQRGIGCDGLVTDAGRPTTTKQRIVTTRNQQVARVDYESDAEATGAIEDALLATVSRELANAAVVVISDYLKGAVTQRTVAHIVEAARARPIPVLVDPKIPHIDYYRGATVVTPNHHEAEVATHLRIRTDDDASRAGRVFLERAGCESVLITRGEHGMSLVGPGGDEHFPAVAREVADVTGAGDTVIATLALAMAAGADTATAARLANYAAGIVVGRFGPATVTPEELLAAF
jgi:D-beta-D-heptose 7-phosphate kinase/D-beta-D-heptose 1-phosphate adenosyltransferase